MNPTIDALILTAIFAGIPLFISFSVGVAVDLWIVALILLVCYPGFSFITNQTHKIKEKHENN